jgi:flagellar hook-length control protein FliK
VLHLAPEHLGAVTITVDVRDGAVRVDLAGGQAAVAAVRDGLDQLRSTLADSGLDLADVRLRSSAGDPAQDRPGEHATTPFQADAGGGAGRGSADDRSRREPAPDRPAVPGAATPAPGSARIGRGTRAEEGIDVLI